MTGSNAPSEGKTITSLETAFNIIELIAENEGMTPGEIAIRLDYSRSTIHYYLTTLEKHRFLTRGDEGYQIGFRFLHYGNRAIKTHDLTGVVRKEVEDLAQETGQTALFAVQQQARCVFLYQSSVKNTADMGHYLGVERYLHSTAFGKALLAYLPDETLNAIVEQHGLPEVNSEAITDHETLSKELAEIREQEFVYGKIRNEDYTCSIAVPIVRDRERERVGAIGIVGQDGEIADPGAHIKAQRFAEKPVTMVKRYAQILRHKIV